MVRRVARMSAEESEAWLGLIGLFTMLPPALNAQLERDAGMTHFEFSLLSVLRFAEGERMQSKPLANATNSTMARLSHVITRLEGRGLVLREPSAVDARATDVLLTRAGRRRLAVATGPHLAFVRSTVLDPLDADDIAALARIADRILGPLDPENRMGHLFSE